jgi:hypothetical protein
MGASDELIGDLDARRWRELPEGTPARSARSRLVLVNAAV